MHQELSRLESNLVGKFDSRYGLSAKVTVTLTHRHLQQAKEGQLQSAEGDRRVEDHWYQGFLLAATCCE